MCVQNPSWNAVTCPIEDSLQPVSAAILCTGGADVIRKEAWSFSEQFPVSAYVGSSKNLKDIKGTSSKEHLRRRWTFGVYWTFSPLGPLCSSRPNIGGHRNRFCRKAMLPFGSHQTPLYRGRPCSKTHEDLPRSTRAELDAPPPPPHTWWVSRLIPPHTLRVSKLKTSGSVAFRHLSFHHQDHNLCSRAQRGT